MVCEITGTITAPNLHSPEQVIHLLVRELQRALAVVEVSSNRAVSFRGPWAVSSLHVLAPFSWGEITLTAQEAEGCRLCYRVSIRRVRVACVLFGAIAVGLWLVGTMPSLMIAPSLVLFWLLYPLNWVVSAWRFRGFLERTLRGGVETGT